MMTKEADAFCQRWKIKEVRQDGKELRLSDAEFLKFVREYQSACRARGMPIPSAVHDPGRPGFFINIDGFDMFLDPNWYFGVDRGDHNGEAIF